MITRHRDGRRLAAAAASACGALLVACGAASPPPHGTVSAPPHDAQASSAPSASSGATASVTATPTASTSTATSQASAPPAPGGPSGADVLAVVQRTYPAEAGGSGGCALSSCPFTPRLAQQIAHLRTETPSPTHQGDVCNYDLLTGNQTGFATPVNPTVTPAGATTTASLPAVNPTVTLVVVDSGGQALVDDILYPMNGDRSIYTLSCTGSL